MKFVEYDKMLETDDAVLRHEIGHALVWFHYGGPIGRLRLSREYDGKLMASMRFGMTAIDIAKRNAVRLLAGEIAARRFLGLPAESATYDFQVPPSARAEAVTSRLGNPHSDMTKALILACDDAGDGWFEWLKARHSEARRLVDKEWQAIEDVAKGLKRHIPMEPRTDVLLPGLSLIKGFEKKAVVSQSSIATEAVHRGAIGSFGMRRYRCYRVHVAKSLTAFEDSGV
ncbi:hypothetical protein HHL24_37310 [Paraburkholderia sp. RP-4-7]|uniref:Peptidase M41 domain-containing protein n=1 Tax=Paraburkholderia polaris TaxID=2728848 RepID=A0A848IU45_9BURK|nr:hypothetical protein [Paraburkholderia polaris]NMM03525.1 hypothetical protein [Paraburkholderia polaris]